MSVEIKITKKQLAALVPPGYRLVDTAVEKWTADGGYRYITLDGNGGLKTRPVESDFAWNYAPVIAPDLPPRPTPEQVAAMRWEGKPVELTGDCRVPHGEYFVGSDGFLAFGSAMHTLHGGRRWILRVVEPPAPKGRWVECEVRPKGCFYRFDYLPMATDLKLETARSIVGYGGTKYDGLDDFHIDIKTDERGIMRRPVAVRFWVEG